jgi:hypothetical protein
MTSKTLRAVALSTLALTLLTGCASIQDQIAKQVASGVVNQATGGKVSMNEQGGNITFKDNQGNVAQIGGGDQRPSSVPEDMPSLPGAKSFGWFGSKDGGIFNFTVASADYKTSCDQMVTMVKASGWTESKSGFTMEIEGTKTTTYDKPGYSLTLTCASSSDSKETNITLTKGKEDNAGSGTTQSSS